MHGHVKNTGLMLLAKEWHFGDCGRYGFWPSPPDEAKGRHGEGEAGSHPLDAAPDRCRDGRSGPCRRRFWPGQSLFNAFSDSLGGVATGVVRLSIAESLDVCVTCGELQARCQSVTSSAAVRTEPELSGRSREVAVDHVGVAHRSAWHLICVRSLCTIEPERFSVSTWPMQHIMVPVAGESCSDVYPGG